MRNALIYLMMLLCMAPLSAQEADTVAMHEADTSEVLPKGRMIPVTGAFLEQLQERDSVLIADQLLYGFRLDGVTEGTRFVLPQLPEKQDYRLMYLSPWTMDTLKVTKQGKGQPRLLDLKGSVLITSFEEGLYELPQIAVGRLTSDGVLDTLVFDPMRLEVKTMPVDTATFVPHDIKGQMRYPVTFAEILPWLGLFWISSMLIILVVCLIIMHRRKSDPAFIRKDPAHIVALRKLDQYRGSKMWAPEKQKGFYSGVTDTLREYISERYGIGAMEMTTAEIFDEMGSKDVPKELLNETKDLFDRADFVKFAKYVASDEDNASTLPVAVRFVTETYQAEVESESPVMSGETPVMSGESPVMSSETPVMSSEVETSNNGGQN